MTRYRQILQHGARSRAFGGLREGGLVLGLAVVLGVPAGWWLIAVVGGAPAATELVSNVGLYLYMALVTALSLLLVQRMRASRRSGGLFDPLTGVHEAGYFHERLHDELATARRKGRPLTVLMIDIDDFSRLLGQYGCARADRVLQTVAVGLVAQVREDDCVARLSSDRFAAILRETTLDHAMMIAGRMRDRIQSETYAGGQGRAFAVTASIGVVSYWRSGVLTPETLLEIAEDAVIRAGGNAVVAAGETHQDELPHTELPLHHDSGPYDPLR
ncbi:GGDEF domain-containing protein [Sinimarinibacterium sp. CAU 1509]|uniref:GGDEF domain-containing protein n=1 Tax=Sinimarinibacterium sp. CAU 1509 TaxID=2562283 RepID=UPI0010AC73CE|nr:GGDEF domain-containing protein [Sinimarinibacterium sp. CAU 1509]TJY63012.1 GGDEF domain-containing protein [Sinimarinibacterium sp. CAU 1509]